MVLPRFVLHGSGLSADGDAVNPRPSARSARLVDHIAHGFHDWVEVTRVHPGFLTDAQPGRLAVSAEVPHEMGQPVPASVGEGGGEVGHLQRRGQQFALADRDGVDRPEVPAP